MNEGAITQFDRANDAAARIERLTARPEPRSGTWRLYLATAVAELDLALHQAMPNQEKLTHSAQMIHSTPT